MRKAFSWRVSPCQVDEVYDDPSFNHDDTTILQLQLHRQAFDVKWSFVNVLAQHFAPGSKCELELKLPRDQISKTFNMDALGIYRISGRYIYCQRLCRTDNRTMTCQWPSLPITAPVSS